MIATLERGAGILAHVTSLPGPFGLGDLGPESVRFLDWVAESGQRVWQVLPLTPVGAGYSPYSSPSAFAGNPLLISPTRLVECGWIDRADVDPPPDLPRRQVAFERAAAWREGMLRRAHETFERRAPAAQRAALEAFAGHAEQAFWLDDWSLFAALETHHGRVGWPAWDEALRRREPGALATARRELAQESRFHRWVQYVFHLQYGELRREAAARGIRILGDLPFYPALDSADVWAHRELFRVDADGRPSRVAGVPPDAFSDEGQLWGQPTYRWDRMAAEGWRWWIARLRGELARVDRLRLDHFRGYAAYWEVEGGRRTARDGRWVEGPGAAPFRAAENRLGPLPLIAEDLGVITDDVRELRLALGVPGMRVLQFMLGDDSGHRPSRYDGDTVAYSGTHDNDTSRAWFEGLSSEDRATVLAGLAGSHEDDVVERIVVTLYESRAVWVVLPLQDVLGLGGEARMNIPGRKDGNWRYRTTAADLTSERSARLAALAARTGR